MSFEQWPEVALGDILSPVSRPVAVPPNQLCRLLGVRWYGNGCHLHDQILGRELKTQQLNAVRPGDITYNKMWVKKGAFGVVDQSHAGLLATAEYPTFEPNLVRVMPEYLRWAFASPAFVTEASQLCRGTTSRARLNPADFLRLRLRLPPTTIQREIATTLSSVDETTQRTLAVIEQLQTLKAAMMAELLTKGTNGRGRQISIGSLGRVRADWPVTSLDKIAQVQTGMAKNKAIIHPAAKTVPYLRVANVQDGFVDLTEIKYIPADTRALERYRLRDGDVLFTEGGDADKLGRGCVWHGQLDPCLHQNHIFAVRCHIDMIRPQFLAYWAASPAGRRYFLSCAKQTTNLASINSSQLKALPIAIPPLAEQDEIVAVLAALDRRRVAEQDVLAATTQLRTSLLASLLANRDQTSSGGASR